MLEIERQFLVKRALLPELGEPRDIVQAYLSIRPEVRVRLTGGLATLTVKSSGDLEREEFEYAIPVEDARSLLALSPYSLVEKRRFRLPQAGLVWEIDEYYGENAGLWSAEVELPDRDSPIERPRWLGEEVTYEKRFKNKKLAERPLCCWPDREAVLAAIDSAAG